MTLVATLWQYRDLAFKLASKDIKVRYKHPILGFLWALLVPTSLILIFYFIFSVLLKTGFEKEVSFAAYISTAMFPWTFFQMALVGSTTCVVESENLIKKVYFPRELIPLSIVLSNLVNFIFSLILLILFLPLLDVSWSWRLVVLPAVISLHLVLTAGLALLISALHVEFRDMKYIVEIMLVVCFYLVPVFYPMEVIARYPWPALEGYLLNPMVGIVTLYRWILLPHYSGLLPDQISWVWLISYTVFISIGVLLIGMAVFKKRQRVFADWV